MVLPLAFGILVAGPAGAAQVAATTAVADQGSTRVTGSSSVPQLAATIVTRRATAVEAMADRATRCSGGRTECSLVDRVVVTVGGHAVEVPPRALLLLADVNKAGLRSLGGGHYELALACGDAAVAYQARLFFTAARIERLDIWSNEAGMMEQSTVFRDVSKAFH